MNKEKAETTAHLPHVIVIGSIGDGFQLIGPFQNCAEAARHGNEDGDIPQEWWIMPIHPASDAEGEQAPAEPKEWPKGCGKRTHVIGTNGGTVPCGTVFDRVDGTSDQALCDRCQLAADQANRKLQNHE